MGRSKGASPERKRHRNAAVLRRRVAELPKVTLKSHEEVIAEAMKDPAFREAYEHLEPRPTSEQRGRHLPRR